MESLQKHLRGKICVRTPQNCNCEWTLTSSNVTWTYDELLRVEYRLNMNLINTSELEDWPITSLTWKLAWVRPNTTDSASLANHYPQPTTSLSMAPFSLFSNPIRFWRAMMRSVTIKGQERGHRTHFLQSETNFRQKTYKKSLMVRTIPRRTSTILHPRALDHKKKRTGKTYLSFVFAFGNF